MPSHTAASGLVKFHLNQGHPWDWQRWQDITGVRHGLFPADDAQLPRGWDRATAVDIATYFDRYHHIHGEDAKIKFAAQKIGGHEIPGRGKWTRWVNEQFKRWAIHDLITQVLSKINLHPVSLMVADNNLAVWPNAGDWVQAAVDDVGLELFGEESMATNGRLSNANRVATQVLIQRTWTNLRRAFHRSKGRIIKLEAQALAAFKALEKGNPTKKKITVVIRAVARWKALAEVLHTTENADKIEEMEDELKHLMEGLGAVVEAVTTSTRMTTVDKKSLSSLASEGDVSEVVNLYIEFFANPAAASDSPIDLEPTLGIVFGESASGADAGVEIECTLSPEVLAQSLGFPDGLPLTFNRLRHRSGLTAWSAANEHLFVDNEINRARPELSPLKLHGHQLAGVHSIIRNIFSEKQDPDHCLGMLVADEVGLGKTFLAASTLAFLSDLRMRQQGTHPLPPIIVARPYLGEVQDIPDRPHLIIAPGTLTQQWENELKVLLKARSFDILQYGTGKAQHLRFWAAEGPYNSCRHPPSQRIIIVSHSALQQDFNLVYLSSPPSTSNLPWDNPDPLPGSGPLLCSTLFGHDYLSCVVDEAHGFKNVGPKHSSILLVLGRALVRLPLTATPLQTSTKDVAGMGRLTGISHFFDEVALIEEKTDVTNVRKAKKALPEDYDALADFEEDIKPDDEKMSTSDPVKLTQVLASQRMQTQFNGHVLRRTINSVDHEGNPLLNLPPFRKVNCVLNLTEREMAIIEILADDVKDSVSTANGTSKVFSRNFYLDYRQATDYACEMVDDGTGEKRKEDIPHFETLEEWEKAKSTKMDTAAKLIAHHLARDDAPDPIFKDGGMSFPLMPSSPAFTQLVKILLYQEFPSLAPPLHNVLTLMGISFLFIDGSMTFEKRAAIVDRFREDDSIRVLIFSSVGSIGLNLSRANIIIFLDQPWSAQDERQIRGRAHRQPQQRIVTCYHLLAANTADIILSGLAQGKRHMMEAFLSRESAKDLVKLFSGETLPNPDDEEENIDTEDDPPNTSKGKAKSKAKDGKSEKKKPPRKSRRSEVIIIDDDDDDDTNAASAGAANQSIVGLKADGGGTTEATSEYNSDVSMLTGASRPPSEMSLYNDDISMNSGRSSIMSTGSMHVDEHEPLPQASSPEAQEPLQRASSPELSLPSSPPADSELPASAEPQKRRRMSSPPAALPSASRPGTPAVSPQEVSKAVKPQPQPAKKNKLTPAAVDPRTLAKASAQSKPASTAARLFLSEGPPPLPAATPTSNAPAAGTPNMPDTLRHSIPGFTQRTTLRRELPTSQPPPSSKAFDESLSGPASTQPSTSSSASSNRAPPPKPLIPTARLPSAFKSASSRDDSEGSAPRKMPTAARNPFTAAKQGGRGRGRGGN